MSHLPADIKKHIRFNADGLVPAIAQQFDTGEVLMMAWMNEASLAETLVKGRAVYWSRSRQALWAKGDTSGHIQKIHDIRLDCDGDTLLLMVDQHGAACHNGTRSCFMAQLDMLGHTDTQDMAKPSLIADKP